MRSDVMSDKCLPCLDMIQQLPTRDLLENQVKPVCFLKVLNQLDYVWVTLLKYKQLITSFIRINLLVYLTMMEQVNLLEDSGPAVSGHSFVNDLDSVLYLSVDVNTGLD